MKRTFLLLCASMVLTVSSFAQAATVAAKPEPKQEAKPKPVNPNAPKLRFTEESYDFGTVVEGPAITHDFKFKNEGKEPLVLSNVHASCGCTVPTWPKEPVLPGKESVISATYNTSGRPGAFTKTITIESNSGEPSKVVTIRGEVIKPEQDKSIPLARPSMLKTND
ncbi:MAG: hypothetical protein JWO03_4074 [Bacteroidetes bacterium]|nr:hypothetical protein [Bacteroidota bacterium]